MSLSIVQQVAREFPELLQENLGSTCWQHTVYVIDRLRQAGHQAFHICKTHGEGQYTPPGFQPRQIVGLDGKGYICTGVSHDAIWCDGLQFDTLAKANDSQEPIFEADGRPMVALPVWNPIPKEFWRPNNPPLLAVDAPPVTPPKPIKKPYPGDAPFDAVGVALFADYALAGNAPDPQMGRWFGRTIFDWLEDNEPTLDASIQKHRAEWRAILGLPPL